MITYKVKKKDKELLNTLIEKEGIKVTFTLGELDANIAQLEKQEKEVDGQRRVHAAEMQNVVLNHPEVVTVSKELRTYVHVYEGFQEKHDEHEELLKKIVETKARLTKEREEIYSTLGLPLK